MLAHLKDCVKKLRDISVLDAFVHEQFNIYIKRIVGVVWAVRKLYSGGCYEDRTRTINLGARMLLNVLSISQGVVLRGASSYMEKGGGIVRSGCVLNEIVRCDAVGERKEQGNENAKTILNVT